MTFILLQSQTSFRYVKSLNEAKKLFLPPIAKHIAKYTFRWVSHFED